MNLAELIGGVDPATTVRLRQGTISGTPSGSIATVVMGTETIAGVRRLDSAQLADGDLVWMVQSGGVLIILGKIGPPPTPYTPWTPGQSTSIQSLSGLEIYHPSSTPYVDFHRSASPAGDAEADYDVRLINQTNGWLNLIGHLHGSGYVEGGSAVMRPWPTDAAYSEFSDNRRGTTDGDYSFLSSSDGNTYVNAKTDTTLHLRIDNSNALTIGPAKDIRGPWGNGSTLPECRGFNVLSDDVGVPAGHPNYIIQAGTVVGFFASGNCHFTFPVAFPKYMYTVVVSEGGGAAGWLIGTQNVTRTGFGAYAMWTDGGVANGFLRVNFFALGS